MSNIALILNSDLPRTNVFADYPHGDSVGIPMYALASTDLSAFCCIVITNYADQRELLRCREQLQCYLQQGGKLVFNGHVVHPFLDELRPYRPTHEPGLAGLQVHNLNAHPIFAGIESSELTYRKGVAGFYGRGFNPPPAGAQVLNELGKQARLPLDWTYPYPGGGQLLVHAGNDFLSFSNAPSAHGMRQAFYDWAAAAPVPGAGITDTQAPRHFAEPALRAESATSCPARTDAPHAARVCFVEGGTYFHHRTLHTPEFAPYLQMRRHVLDLGPDDFAAADTLVFCCETRGDLIARHRSAITRFLDQGKTVVAMGNTNPQQWLPQVSWTDCPTNFWWWITPGADSGLRLLWPEHSLFNYITLADATWHQHGSFAIPEGARSLIDKEGHGSVLYEDRHSTPGRLIVTSLDPCYHHGSYFMPATTRFLRGFLPWLHEHTAQAGSTG
ncbi:hypothetical protein [Marinobacter sp. LQ44]|uniref:hypothetical protein n=1 Tax=unclassified Marinobacter TaxID=83889 RepID=UPI000A95A027|nr:hypothetical protein [Marinobacter sp. LQ44]